MGGGSAGHKTTSVRVDFFQHSQVSFCRKYNGGFVLATFLSKINFPETPHKTFTDIKHSSALFFTCTANYELYARCLHCGKNIKMALVTLVYSYAKPLFLQIETYFTYKQKGCEITAHQQA